MHGDAHIHLNACYNAAEILSFPVKTLCVSCTPTEWRESKEITKGSPAAKAALGLHPWWVPAESTSRHDEDELFNELVTQFLESAPHEHLIGEIGMDLYGGRKKNSNRQIKVFEKLCHCLAKESHVISLHTRAADDIVLEILEQTGVLRSSVCVLHGFSGSSQAMNQASSAGCHFSVGHRELKTKRWHEYAKQLPLKKILVESDAPWTALRSDDNTRHELDTQEWQNSLEDAVALLSNAKGESAGPAIEENLAQLLV